MNKIMQYLGDETGASAAEYALILALVAVAIILGLTALGKNINAVLGSVASTISTASAS
jgi:pilus assembly protein Flp/PilA